MDTKTIVNCLIIVLLFSSFNFNNKLEKENNSKSAIDNEDFSYILNYFDRIVKTKCNSFEIWQCYNYFCDDIHNQISKRGQITIDTFGLDSVLTIAIKNKILNKTIGKARNNQGLWNEKTFYQINLEGRFSAFLKEQAENDKFVSLYYDKLKLIGDIGPSTFSMMQECQDINFKDRNIQLIYAMHWITYFANYY